MCVMPGQVPHQYLAIPIETLPRYAGFFAATSSSSRAAPPLLQEINPLRTRPPSYNALTDNGTTEIPRLGRGGAGGSS
jgi:hypothetical protein